MPHKYRSFFIAAFFALLFQVAFIFIFKIASNGFDCGIFERRVCSPAIFVSGIMQLVASINMYTLGIPTIALALLTGGAWRMYRELRKDGLKLTDLLSR